MKVNPILKNDGQTNLQFKLLSAVGIIIIVSGHCYHGGISLGYEWFPTYSFQLSLFVFISGYFYQPESEKSVLRYILKRFKRLVIPAYIWNMVYGLLILLMKRFGYSIGAEVNPYNLFLMPWVDGEAFQYNLGSWFVYPLFLVCVFHVLFCKLTGFLKLKNKYVILAVYFVIGVFGINIAISGQATGVLKLFARAMFFLPTYQLGHLYRARWERYDTLRNLPYFALLFAIQLILLTFTKDLEYYPSAMKGFQNGVLIPYIISITGIAFWLRITRLLTPVIGSSKTVRMIGDNTYSIMVHQMFGFMCVKWIFLLIDKITGSFPDFNVTSLRSSIWYYYLPNGLKQYAIIYLAAGVFIPIAIKAICDLLYKAGVEGMKRIIHSRKSSRTEERS